MDAHAWDVPWHITTERLTIRAYRPQDAESLAAVTLANAEHLGRYLPWARGDASVPAPDLSEATEARRAWIEAATEEFAAGDEYTMGVFSSADGQLIGGSGYHPRTEPRRLDIGFWLAERAQGQGYMTEAAAALTRVALEYCGADVVSIAHAPTNRRSEAVARRLGYARQEWSPGPCADGDQMVEAVVWCATAEALAEAPLALVPRPGIADADGSPLAWPS